MNASPGNAYRRFAAGLAAGAVLGVALGYVLLKGAQREEARVRAERRAVVTLRALTDLIDRAGGTGEPVRRVAAAWQASHPGLTAIRVALFEGLSLEASTAAEDTDEKTAPRRLTREEKDFYDRGQRLRAAVETNRQEGAARKEEVEIEKLPTGSLSLAAPLEREGAAVGLVETRTVVTPERPAPSLPVAAAYVLTPVVLFLLAGIPLKRSRAALALLTFLLLAGTVVGYAAQSLKKLERERRASEASVAGAVRDESRQAVAILSKLSLPTAAALKPASWDCDEFRHPRGLISDDGRINEAALSVAIAKTAGQAKRALAGVGILALGLLAFVGFGAAARLIGTLIRYHIAYTYTMPAMVGMVLLVFFPFLYGIAISFTDQNIYNTSKPLTEIWLGFRNYIQILGDFSIAKRAADGALIFNYLNFYWTFFFTIVWTVTNVTLGVTSGLILALILNTKGLALRPIYRVLLILPWAMPNYITALIWKGMFHQQFGVVNQVIQMFGGQGVSWFQKPFSSYLTALATNGWLSFPFMMVISLGALQSIPAELYEAARVDGASRWQQFKAITLPSLKPALIPAIILSVIWTFNMFNIIYLVTQGEPASSTEILITQSYKFAFEKYQYGYAAAYSTIIFAILLIYGSIQNRVTRATEAI